MIYNIENRIKDSALVNLTDFENAIDLYEDGELEKALELLFGLITLGFGGEFETEDREVRRLLRNREYTVAKSNKAYCNKAISNEIKQREKLQLDDIAEMMANGATQQIMADSLCVSLNTIKYRVNIMKEKYPALYNESIEKSKKYKKVQTSWNNDKEKGNDNDNDNDNVNDNVNANDNANEKENGKANGEPPSFLSEKENNDLIAQQPTKMPIPERLTLTDWRAQINTMCKPLQEWERDLLRAELARLPLDKQNSPCWVYCAFKKMKVASGRVKDNAYRLNYAPFQKEVDEMVDAERAALEARIHQQNEIENSISPNMPKRQMIIVPRMEKERPKEIYNIEDF